MKEEWREVKGYEGLYRVSSNGEVYSVKSGKILMPCLRGDYFTVKLYKNGKEKKKSLHCLVAETFIENTAKLLFVDHISRNKKDNRVDNLRWATKSMNIRNSLSSLNARSKYNGVYLPKGRYLWKAQIKVNKVSIYIGSFKKETEAAKAFNQFCIEHNLDRELNIIEEA